MQNYDRLPPNLVGLPNAAFTDTSGDKDSKISGIDSWEVIKEIIVSTNLNYAGLMWAWSLKTAGNALGYNVLLGVLVSIGLGFLFWSLYRFFGTARHKPKVTWRLFDWGVGCLLALMLHYVF